MKKADNVPDVYERHADAWVAARLRENNLYERGWLDRFCALIPVGGSVLDIGCGAGEPIARHLHESGYAVTGVDSSPSMVGLFQQRLPSCRALTADMRSLNLGARFNGILAWDSFFHLSPDSQRRMFPIFKAHAAPGAALMFTSGTHDGEAVGNLEGDALYHASLDPDDYHTLLDGEGFHMVDHVTEDPTCGRRTIWLAQLG